MDETEKDELRRLEALRLAHCEFMSDRLNASQVTEKAKVYYNFLRNKE